MCTGTANEGIASLQSTENARPREGLRCCLPMQCTAPALDSLPIPQLVQWVGSSASSSRGRRFCSVVASVVVVPQYYCTTTIHIPLILFYVCVCWRERRKYSNKKRQGAGNALSVAARKPLVFFDEKNKKNPVGTIWIRLHTASKLRLEWIRHAS